LSDKDYIKELFQNKLGGHEVKVDPQLWQGVQSQLGNLASTGAAGSAAVAGKVSLLIKIGVAAAITTAAITTYVLVKNNETSKVSENSAEPVSPVASEGVLELNQNSTSQTYTDSAELSSADAATSSASSATHPAISPSSAESATSDRPKQFIETDLTQDNSSYPEIKVDKEKTASVSSSAHSTDVTTEPLKINIEFSKESNQHYVFSAIAEEVDKIVWEFGDGSKFTGQNAEHVYTESGSFEVVAKAFRKNEVVESSVSILVDVAGKITHLPTLFTPNGDGSNDEFFIESEGLGDFSVVIMNDKGEILFESNAPDFRWDGRERNSGLVADDGAYFYIITAKDELGNTISKHQRLQLKK
jgi:gliding motility-associated-like protein